MIYFLPIIFSFLTITLLSYSEKEEDLLTKIFTFIIGLLCTAGTIYLSEKLIEGDKKSEKVQVGKYNNNFESWIEMIE